MPDKNPWVVTLGVEGERRFAPRVGRAGVMKDTEPGVSYAFVPVYTCCVLVFCLKCCRGAAQQGDLWVKIDLHGMDLRMFLGQQKLARQSFIFIKKQKVGVETAYSIPEPGRSV